MVYIDTESIGGWCHLVASSIDELHTFAESIGRNRCWYENKRGKNQPHYDMRGVIIQKAIDNGAVLVSRSELFTFLESNYGDQLMSN